ncbi:MAG: hypothetical protein PHF57_03170 [Methanoregula sp.]|jgi:hypothetical protein|nr:hypothetical protein [Methanoregula sp.]MDD5024318.1 hypothetical protein [Methanoregula sp.]MDD5187189.1 hypothetical protein [Methanoregula sp.]
MWVLDFLLNAWLKSQKKTGLMFFVEKSHCILYGGLEILWFITGISEDGSRQFVYDAISGFILPDADGSMMVPAPEKKEVDKGETSPRTVETCSLLRSLR